MAKTGKTTMPRHQRIIKPLPNTTSIQQRVMAYTFDVFGKTISHSVNWTSRPPVHSLYVDDYGDRYEGKGMSWTEAHLAFVNALLAAGHDAAHYNGVHPDLERALKECADAHCPYCGEYMTWDSGFIGHTCPDPQ